MHSIFLFTLLREIPDKIRILKISATHFSHTHIEVINYKHTRGDGPSHAYTTQFSLKVLKTRFGLIWFDLVWFGLNFLTRLWKRGHNGENSQNHNTCTFWKINATVGPHFPSESPDTKLKQHAANCVGASRGSLSDQEKLIPVAYVSPDKLVFIHMYKTGTFMQW